MIILIQVEKSHSLSTEYMQDIVLGPRFAGLNKTYHFIKYMNI